MTKMRRPPRSEQLELFIACFTDIAFRDHRDMMERPFFSLNKNPRLRRFSIKWAKCG